MRRHETRRRLHGDVMMTLDAERREPRFRILGRHIGVLVQKHEFSLSEQDALKLRLTETVEKAIL